MAYVLRFEKKNEIPSVKRYIKRKMKELGGREYQVRQIGNYLLIAVKNMRDVLEGNASYAAHLHQYSLEKIGTRCEVVKTGEYEDRDKFIRELRKIKPDKSVV